MKQRVSCNHLENPSDQSVGGTALDVKAQSERLRHAFEEPAFARTDAVGDLRAGLTARLRRPSSAKAMKIAVGLALIAIFGIAPARRMFDDSSIDAIVNARLITVRAPIEGVLQRTSFRSSLGVQVRMREPLFTIFNLRADRSRVDDLARELGNARARRDGLSARLHALQALFTKLLTQVDAFSQARRIQIEANLNDLKAQLAGAEANRTQLENDFERARTLSRSGVQAQAALERTQRDVVVASEASRSLREKLISAQAELNALDHGYFVGDAYNDRPSSRQQADDISIRIAETKAELASANASVQELHAEFDKEQLLQEARSTAAVLAPGAGPVWDVLVTPGEAVARGQSLLRILDCSSGLVTGTVRKSVYEKLSIGQPAQFHADGAGRVYTGTIARLSPSESTESLAIPSSGQGPYRVTVAIPALASRDCSVGHGGRLVFTPASSGNAAEQGMRALALRGQQS